MDHCKSWVMVSVWLRFGASGGRGRWMGFMIWKRKAEGGGWVCGFIFLYFFVLWWVVVAIVVVVAGGVVVGVLICRGCRCR